MPDSSMIFYRCKIMGSKKTELGGEDNRDERREDRDERREDNRDERREDNRDERRDESRKAEPFLRSGRAWLIGLKLKLTETEHSCY